MTLRNVKVGQTVQVTRLNGEGALRRRIMDMALLSMSARWPRWGTRWRSLSADTSCPSARTTLCVSKWNKSGPGGRPPFPFVT